MKKVRLSLDYIDKGRLSKKEMNEIFGGYIFCSPYCTISQDNGKRANTCGIYEECTSSTNKKNLCSSPSNGTYGWSSMPGNDISSSTSMKTAANISNLHLNQ
jgi:hypothetical protein